jgi:hypothetical protein
MDLFLIGMSLRAPGDSSRAVHPAIALPAPQILGFVHAAGDRAGNRVGGERAEEAGAR